MVSRATPKSMIFTVPSWLMKTLAGLMSRWTMPAWWAWARPASTCTMIVTLRSRVIGGGWRTAFWRSCPLSSSIAMNGEPSVVVAEVEDGHHVGVGHLRDGLAPRARSAASSSGIVGDLRDHDLQGDVALEHGVVGEIHDAHRPLAERLHDVVLPDPARELLDDGRSGARISSAHALTEVRVWSSQWRRLRRDQRFPVTVGLARRLRAQQSSVSSEQTVISLP